MSRLTIRSPLPVSLVSHQPCPLSLCAAWTVVDTPLSFQWGGFPFDTGSHPFTRIINESHGSDTRVLFNTSTVPGVQTFPASPPAKRMALYVGLPQAQESLTQLEKAGLRWSEGSSQVETRAGDVIAARYLAGVPSAKIAPIHRGLALTGGQGMQGSAAGHAQTYRQDTLPLLHAEAGAPVTFYLSPDGNDTWSGSSSSVDNSTTPVTGPWASPARAQAAVQAALAQGAAGAQVYLANGTYYLLEPLVLGAADSGTGSAPGSRVLWSRDPALPPLPAGQPTDVILSGGALPQAWGAYSPDAVELSVSVSRPPPPPKSPWSCKIDPNGGNSPYGICSASFNPPPGASNSGVGPTEMYWAPGRARLRPGQSPQGPDPTLGWGYESLSSPNMTWQYLQPLDDTTAFAWFGIQFEATNKSTPRGPDQDWYGYSCDTSDPRIHLFHPDTGASVHGVLAHDEGAFYKNGYFQFDTPTAVPISADGGITGSAGARYLIAGMSASCGSSWNVSGRFHRSAHDSGYDWSVNQLPGMNMSSTEPAVSEVVGSRLPNVLTLSGAAHVDFFGIAFQHASGSRTALCATSAPCDAPANAWVNTAAVLITDGTRDVMLQACDVSLNGGLGVLITNGSAAVTLSHCTLADNGAGAIRVGPGLLQIGAPLPAPVSMVTIANSTISVTGTTYPSAAGIHISGGTSAVTVSHCSVSNTTGPGIVIGIVPDGNNAAGSTLAAPSGVLVQYSRVSLGGLYLTDVSAAVAVYGPPGALGLTLDHLILQDQYGWNQSGHGIAVLPGPAAGSAAPTTTASLHVSNVLCARTKAGLLALDGTVSVNVTVANSIWASGAYNALVPALNPTGDGGLQVRSLPGSPFGAYLTFLTNIVLATAGTLFPGPWPAPAATPQPPYRFNNNVYFSPGAAVPMTFPAGLSASAWQAAGQDVRGLVAVDPGVTGPDYVVPPTSPAVTQCGFVPIDYSHIGPQG